MWMWQRELTVAPAHLNQLVEVHQVAVVVVVVEDAILAGEEGTKVDVEMVGSLLVNSKRSHLIPPLTKERLRIPSARYARNLATLLLRVGSGLHRQEQQIHLDED